MTPDFAIGSINRKYVSLLYLSISLRQRLIAVCCFSSAVLSISLSYSTLVSMESFSFSVIMIVLSPLAGFVFTYW